ncbi:MAG: phosphotransferase [Anaerolineaceae bacterium]|nr:phosphotransferase [Anaerolineaceae bacterium]
MNDTRMTWVTYFSPNPENVVIVLPQDINAAAIETLLDQCGEAGQPKFVRQVDSSTSVSPLTESQLDDLGCDTAIYLLRNRSSFKSIKKAIHSIRDCKVEEYSVFPGWSNPRWIVPKERSLWFGKMSRMIQPTKLVPKFAVAIFRVLKLIGMSHYLFPCRLIVAYNKKSSFKNFYSGLDADVRTGIVYTGSYGPLQKFTVELVRGDNRPFAYAKFGHSELSKQAINNERKILNDLRKLPLKKVVFPEFVDVKLPEIIGSRTIIIKKLAGGRSSQKYTDTLIYGLAEIFKATEDHNSLGVKEYIKALINCLQELSCTGLQHEYLKMRDDVLSILYKISTRPDNYATLPLCLSHGDFTRWNVRADDDKIYVIDWEESTMRPVGHDLLSFLLREYLSVSKAEPETVVPRIIEEMSKGLLDQYLEKIDTTNSPSLIDKSLISIFFFSEVFRSNLWHMNMHSLYNYPEKKSLGDLVKTSWACCLHFSHL